MFYPYNINSTIHDLMVENNIISPIVEQVITAKKNKEIERIKTNYTNDKLITQGLILPYTIEKSFSGSSNLRVVTTFNKYDKGGRAIQITDKDGLVTSYIWGYGGQYIVAEAKNATIDQLKQRISGLSDIHSTPLHEGLELCEIKLRYLGNIFITTYEIEPLIGIKSILDPSGSRIHYHYDELGRLSAIIDGNNNVIKSFEYNYRRK